MQSTDQALDMPKGSRGRTAARTRKDKTGQAAVFKPEALAVKVDHLIGLHKAKSSAATDFSEAIKAVAEACGQNAKAVRSYITARAGENFEERKRDAEQLSLIFDSIPG